MTEVPFTKQSRIVISDQDPLAQLQALESEALACHKTGDYLQAQGLYEQCLCILEKAWLTSQDRSLLIKAHHRLGLLHRVQNQFEPAEKHYLSAFRIAEELYGSEHDETALRRNYLAGLFFAVARYDESRQLLEQSLVHYEKTLPKTHEVIAVTLFALALVTRPTVVPTPTNAADQQNVVAAPVLGGQCKNYYDRAHSISEINVTALPLSNSHDLFRALMKLSYEAFGEARFQEAEELFRHSLLLELNEVWPDHPLVADSYQLLADLYRALGKEEAAEHLYRNALAIRKAAYGNEDEKVAATADSLATLLCAKGKYEEAEKLLEEALRIRRNGAFQPLLAKSLQSYAMVLKMTGRGNQAQAVSAEAQQILDSYGHRTSN